MPDRRVRPATAADAAPIARIRNHAVETGIALWTHDRIDADGVVAWLAGTGAAGHAFLVAEVEGVVAGYATYGPWRPQVSGFLHTVEDSVYVDPTRQGTGLGSALLGALVAHARAAGRHVMVADVEAGNLASIRLHERHGFVVRGTLPAVGTKFGGWLDLTLLTLQLDAGG